MGMSIPEERFTTKGDGYLILAEGQIARRGIINFIESKNETCSNSILIDVHISNSMRFI